MAVLKIDAVRRLPALKLGNSGDASVGQWVLAVSTPRFSQQSATAGIICGKRQRLPGERCPGLRDVLQTDAAIRPGSGGSPLVNVRGKVIGINVAIGLAIGADTAKKIVPELIQHGIVKRAWLGITLSKLTENLKDYYAADRGMLIADILADSPASYSDLAVEDVTALGAWTKGPTIISPSPLTSES